MNRQVKISAACMKMLEANSQGELLGRINPDRDGFAIEVTQEIFDRFLSERTHKEDFSNWFSRSSLGSEIKRPPAVLQVYLLDMDEHEKTSDLACYYCGLPLPERYFDIRDKCLPDPCPVLWGGDFWLVCSQKCVDRIFEEYNGK